MDIFVTLCALLWQFLSNLVYCEFGENVTHHFNLFDDELERCNWYLFPIDLQRLILITMLGSQQPEVIQGFANTACTRIAFKRVSVIF